MLLREILTTLASKKVGLSTSKPLSAHQSAKCWPKMVKIAETSRDLYKTKKLHGFTYS